MDDIEFAKKRADLAIAELSRLIESGDEGPRRLFDFRAQLNVIEEVQGQLFSTALAKLLILKASLRESPIK